MPGVGGVFLDVEAGVLEGFYHVLDGDEIATAQRAVALSVPWIEVLGATIWLEIYGERCACARVLLAIDADTAVQVLARVFSADDPLMVLLRRYRLAVARAWATVRVRSIVGDEDNGVADKLSHLRVQAASREAWARFGLPLAVRRV